MSEKAELGSQTDGLGIWVQVKNWLQIYCNQIQGGLERKQGKFSIWTDLQAVWEKK